jgi:RNA polymerase subunit RPABC4/transcription elongation factor Spt4
MSDVRCRACGAAVPTEAQWCSLCYADLREPSLARERVSVPAAPGGAGAAAPEPVAVAVAAAHPSNGLRPDPDALLGLPPKSADADGPQDDQSSEGAEEETPEKTWPCTRCGEQVGMSLDVCPACGSGFLAGASTPASMRLPVVGDIGRLSRSQRLIAGLGVSLVVIVVLVVLATIGGHVL